MLLDDYNAAKEKLTLLMENDDQHAIDAQRDEVSMFHNLLMQRYRTVLATLCGYLGIINRYADHFHEDHLPDNNVLIELSERLAGLKDELLSLKAALELPGGLSFLENNNFDGFSIIDGRFSGDKEKVRLILPKWLNGFPEKVNNYQYEVAVLVSLMAFPETIDTIPEKQIKKGGPISWIKRLQRLHLKSA